MSYDLNFWKYEDEAAAHDHLEVYRRLSNGEFVEGLQTIPIDDIIERVRALFGALGWTTDDDETWSNEDESSAFQIYATPQFFRVDCYGGDGEDLNALIDIACEFGLPLYDPQVSKRF